MIHREWRSPSEALQRPPHAIVGWKNESRSEKPLDRRSVQGESAESKRFDTGHFLVLFRGLLNQPVKPTILYIFGGEKQSWVIWESARILLLFWNLRYTIVSVV